MFCIYWLVYHKEKNKIKFRLVWLLTSFILFYFHLKREFFLFGLLVFVWRKKKCFSSLLRAPSPRWYYKQRDYGIIKSLIIIARHKANHGYVFAVWTMSMSFQFLLYGLLCNHSTEFRGYPEEFIVRRKMWFSRLSVSHLGSIPFLST